MPKNDYEFVNAIAYERSKFLEIDEVADIYLGRTTIADIRKEMAVVYSSWLDLILCFDSEGKPDYFNNGLIDKLTDAFICEAKSIYEAE